MVGSVLHNVNANHSAEEIQGRFKLGCNAQGAESGIEGVCVLTASLNASYISRALLCTVEMSKASFNRQVERLDDGPQ